MGMFKEFMVKGDRAKYGLSSRVRIASVLIAVLLLIATVLVIVSFGLYPAIPLLAVALALLVLALYRDEWIFDNRQKLLGDVLGWIVPSAVREFNYKDMDGLEVSSFQDGAKKRYTLAFILKKDGTRIDIEDSRNEEKLKDLALKIAGFTGLRFY